MTDSVKLLRVRVYIHDRKLVLLVLDLPPVISAQTLQDAVKGSDGLKPEDSSERPGPGCSSGFWSLVQSEDKPVATLPVSH